MAKGFSIEVDGLDEALRRVRSLSSALEAKDVEKVLLKGVQPVRQEARRRAPVRKGRLRKAIKARIGKRRGRMVASAFAAVDLKVAPHAYLVEYGTRHSRARAYFRPAWDMTKNQVQQTIEDGLRKLLEGKMR